MLATPLLTTSAPPLRRGGKRESIDYVSFRLTKGGEQIEYSSSPPDKFPSHPLAKEYLSIPP